MSTDQTVKQANILAVDVGNTITRLGFACDLKITDVWECSTRESLTVDEARLLISGFLQNKGMSLTPEDSAIACSVPMLAHIWSEALGSQINRKPLLVGPGVKTGLKMIYNDPAEVGADRIADVVAAKASYGFPLIVVDMGTSTSFAVVDRDGAYIGGLLAPGLELSARALSSAAARLPQIELQRPRTVIGKCTKDAMQAGFVLGEGARIDGLIDAIAGELGYTPKIVITGESAAAIAELLGHQCIVDESLTLKGLVELYALNRCKD